MPITIVAEAVINWLTTNYFVQLCNAKCAKYAKPINKVPMTRSYLVFNRPDNRYYLGMVMVDYESGSLRIIRSDRKHFSISFSHPDLYGKVSRFLCKEGPSLYL